MNVVNLMVMKKKIVCIIFTSAMAMATFVTSCTPHKFFILNSEGILTYDRNKGTFEVLWQTKTAGVTPDSGTVKIDSICLGH